MNLSPLRNILDIEPKGQTLEEPDRFAAVSPGNLERSNPDIDLPAIGIFVTDAGGRMVSCSGKAISRLDSKCGETPSDGTNGFFRRPEHSREDGPIDFVLKTGSAIHDLELTVSPANGQSRHLVLYSNPLRDSSGNISGNITGTVNLVLDVTCRKKTAERMAQLAAILDSPAEVITFENLDGIITGLSGGFQELFGYGVDELIGRPIGLLFPPEEYREQMHVPGCLSNGRPGSRLHTVCERRDGTRAAISMIASPIKNTDGQLIGVSKTIRNLNGSRDCECDLRRLYGELVSMERANEHFIASLHEDAVTLVDEVLLAAKNVLCPLELTSLVEGLLEMIRTNVRSETDLINILLDLACIELATHLS